MGSIEQGHVVDQAADGRDGLFLASDGAFDLVIIDRMLPGLDGLSVVRALRAAGIGTPVLILSALGSVDDRIDGLEGGSDDYLAKPFAFAELLARINALLRRAEGKASGAVETAAGRRRSRNRPARPDRAAARHGDRAQAARI